VALISCPECEERLSTHAELCPHCGYPYKKKRLKRERLRMTVVLSMTLLAAIGSAIAALRTKRSPEERRAPAARTAEQPRSGFFWKVI
jgi:hypothetical protein